MMRYMEPDDFTGGVDKRQVNYIQDTLNIKLPESYKWFLYNYGSGGLYGVDILGVAKSNISTVVIETEKYRDLKMSENLVVIEDIVQYAYCLNTSKMKNIECPIIVWVKKEELVVFKTAENFFDFLFQELFNAKKLGKKIFKGDQ